MAFHGWKVEALEFFEGLEADNSKAYWQRAQGRLRHDRPGADGGAARRAGARVRRGPDLPPLSRRSVQPRQVPVQDRDRGDDREGYVQVDARGLAVGSGKWEMAPDQLERYREAVADDALG